MGIARVWRLAVALALSAWAAPAAAADVPVAVAANFTAPAKAISEAFTRSSGHRVSLSFGSSGAFYAQIAHGAPFKVFLSADAERPLKVEQAGLGVPGTRFTYAVGRLALYSAAPGLVDPKGSVLRAGRFAKLAIADPATAPYGAAAVQTLQKMGLWPALQAKVVEGADITQAYQFTATGSADLGFVALSQAQQATGGSQWTVPDSLHAPIEQQAILLAPGKDDPAARAFMAFLKGPAAKAIIRRYGYGAP